MLIKWLVPGILAGGPHPAPSGDRTEVQRAIRELRAAGVGAIITLTEHALDLDGAFMDHMHAATPDGEPPRHLDTICTFIDAARRRGEGTFVHCLAGIGRTGTVLAAWLIWSRGLSAWAAIDEVRATYHRFAVESQAQTRALEAFGDNLKG